MSLREEFVRLATRPGANRRELCRRFGISPDTGYRLLARFGEGGVAGLADRSRRPKRSPRRTSPELEAAVLALRARHPTWGGRKLAARLRALGHAAVPAPSTITAILRRHDLLDPDRAGRPHDYRRFERDAPNELWQMDFKGHVPCGAARCHPLTVLDDYSRYALTLAACADEQTETVRTRLIRTFRHHGLPDRMLVDNGPPWGTAGAEHGYTPLTIWLLRLGVRVSHSRPRHPQTLGKDERFHRTLKAELLGEPLSDLNAAQQRFDAWRHVYNHERPHEAAGRRGAGQPLPAERAAPIQNGCRRSSTRRAITCARCRIAGESSSAGAGSTSRAAFAGFPSPSAPSTRTAVGRSTSPPSASAPSTCEHRRDHPAGVRHVSEHP